MANKKTTLILTIGTSIVLFILTLMISGKLFELLLPKIENLRYQTTEMTGQFRLGLFFSIAIGLSPILLYLTWRLSPIRGTKKKTLSVLIVLGCMAFAVFIRQQTIKSTYNGLTNLKTQTGEIIYNSFSNENTHFEYYLLGGLISGYVVSFFTLKDK